MSEWKNIPSPVRLELQAFLTVLKEWENLSSDMQDLYESLQILQNKTMSIYDTTGSYQKEGFLIHTGIHENHSLWYEWIQKQEELRSQAINSLHLFQSTYITPEWNISLRADIVINRYSPLPSPEIETLLLSISLFQQSISSFISKHLTHLKGISFLHFHPVNDDSLPSLSYQKEITQLQKIIKG